MPVRDGFYCSFLLFLILGLCLLPASAQAQCLHIPILTTSSGPARLERPTQGSWKSSGLVPAYLICLASTVAGMSMQGPYRSSPVGRLIN